MQVRIHSHMRDQTWEGQVPKMHLEDLFRYFNRVEEGDNERLRDIGYTLPSLSVGDVVWVEGFCFACASVGWERVENADLQPV